MLVSYFFGNFVALELNRYKIRMMRHRIYILCMLLGMTLVVGAQEAVISPLPVMNRQAQANVPDTVLNIKLDEEDLDAIGGIRSRYEKQNETYSRPTPPSKGLLRFLNKDKLEMSPEALYWVNLVRDASTLFDENMTFRDTVIVNPLYLPQVYRGDIIKNDHLFYDPDRYKEKSPLEEYMPETEILADYARKMEFEKNVRQHLQSTHPDYYRYSAQMMPNDMLIPVPIQKNVFETLPIVVEPEVKVEDVEAPIRFIPDRLYWRSAFESAIQFSQNYISPNWHKGGTSNLNLFTKNHLKYDYKKDKVQVTNEIEIKISAYTAPKDTLRNYKMGDDLIRIHNNLGYQAFNQWYYTFDSEIKTQLFTSYQENKDLKLASILAPITATFGLGMKYELNKKYTDKHKNLKLSLNMAPISYTYMYSRIKDPEEMDLGRHGFEKDPKTDLYRNTLSKLGSNVRADLTVNFNRNVSWQSRLYYLTSYDRVLVEFENTLVMAISRFFSTRIYVYARFDDAAERNEDFNYFQLNELLSFGFNYKW